MTQIRSGFVIFFLVIVSFLEVGCTDDDDDATQLDGDGISSDTSADTGSDGDVEVPCLDKQIEPVAHQGLFAIGEKAPDFRAETYDGQTIVLSCLLEEGPVVLEFLRTFS